MALKAGLSTCSMVFEGSTQNVGWTETWQSNIASLDQAMDALKALATARIGMLSGQFTISYLRASAVQAPKVPPARNQRIAYLTRHQLGGSLDPTEDGDLAFVSALVRFYNTDKTVFALRQFRGLPDGWWKSNDDKTAQASIQAPLRRFTNALVAGGFGITHKLPAGGVQLQTMTLGVFERLTRRATGRPLYLSRGRRAKRGA